MPEPSGALERGARALAVATLIKQRKRRDYDRQQRMAEVEQQFQAEISGTAVATPVFADVSVSFDYPMHYAPAQRDNPFEKPHFWFGSETSPPVFVVATVVSWQEDPDNGAITGATVAVGATGNNVAFTGVVHLTFQGFGALFEDESNITQTDSVAPPGGTVP